MTTSKLVFGSSITTERPRNRTGKTSFRSGAQNDHAFGVCVTAVDDKAMRIGRTANKVGRCRNRRGMENRGRNVWRARRNFPCARSRRDLWRTTTSARRLADCSRCCGGPSSHVVVSRSRGGDLPISHHLSAYIIYRTRNPLPRRRRSSTTDVSVSRPLCPPRS